ncbi:hypothetical protein EL17_19940 [Anditalea andensis]|uniref:Uncharacterized protein n=1 Tax=Anditalea andensis TaxID=1048983 RepID=A0A074KTG5_9BACT|nr:hypothetical protein EL17_19940 [Anditalea andensis]
MISFIGNKLENKYEYMGLSDLYLNCKNRDFFFIDYAQNVKILPISHIADYLISQSITIMYVSEIYNTLIDIIGRFDAG